MGDNKNSIDKKSFAGKGVFPHKFAFTLLIPIRNIFLSPERLIERLELKENFLVLEIGPDFLIPVGDSNGDTEFFVHCGLLGSYRINKLILSTELVGTVIITQDVDTFGDRFVNMVNFGAQWNESFITPMVYFKFFLRHDISRSLDGVLGVGVNVSLD